LSIVTGVTNAFIAEFADSKARVRTLAFWMNGEFVQNQEWDLAGTPCEVVLWGKLCHYPENVEQLFPSGGELTSVGFLTLRLPPCKMSSFGHSFPAN